MNTESIRQLATDINNVAAMSFQSGKEHIERPLMAKIKQLQDENEDLLKACKALIDNWTNPHDADLDDVFCMIQEAIAKAEGVE